MIRFTVLVPALIALCTAYARAQGVVLSENFESGAPGWTFQGFCHIEPDTTACGALVAPFPSPGHCVWFGTPATCDYSGPPGYGELDPPNPIALPLGQGQLVLRWRRFRDTEPCGAGYDVTSILITGPAGQVQYLYTYDCSLEPGWSDRRLDLGPWAGTSIALHMNFDTGDPIENETLGYWVDDVEIVREPGTVTCTADTSCPCAGQSHMGYVGFQGPADSGGCKHSAGKEARLFGNGVQSVASDTVELVAHDLPSSTALIYVQGTTQQSVPFGDGRRCFGGTAARLAVRSVSGGGDTYPHVGELGVALKGMVPAGGATRTYQVVYRDAAMFCTSSTFNTSNAYTIAWRP